MMACELANEMCTDTRPESASLLGSPKALVSQFFTLNSQQGVLETPRSDNGTDGRQ